MSEHHYHHKRSSLGKNRVEAFSDGVFAVAMTILVLNLQSPALYQMVVGIHVQQDLAIFLPQFIVYVLSFIIVGIYWVAHHNTFHYIRQSDRNLLWLNILLLICVVFIPFSTALLGLYPQHRISLLIYGGTLVATGIALQSLWWYVTSKRRLVDKDIDPQLIRRATRRNIQAPCIYAVAMLVSFFSIPASLAIFLLVPVTYILPGRIDRHWIHHEHSHSGETNNGQEAKTDTTVSAEQLVPQAQLFSSASISSDMLEHQENTSASSMQHSHYQHHKSRKKRIPGKTFYQRQIAALERRDIEGLIAQYHPEATLAGLDFVLEGQEAIRQHFEHYLASLGDFKLKSTEKFVETSDAIFFEATVESAHGTARVYNIFVLDDEKATHHFTGSIPLS